MKCLKPYICKGIRMVNVNYDASIWDVHICVPIPYETIEAPESILVNTSSLYVSNFGHQYHVSNTLKMDSSASSDRPNICLMSTLEVIMTEIVMNRWERTLFNVWRCMLIHT